MTKEYYSDLKTVDAFNSYLYNMQEHRLLQAT